MRIYDYTLRADGNIISHRKHGTTALEPRAVLAFADIMREAHYNGPVHPVLPQIRLKWNLAKVTVRLLRFSLMGK